MDNLIDGKAVAAKVRAEVAERTKKLHDETGILAGLAVIIVGEDPASQVYVANKHKACHEAGITPSRS
jgi:methylenetetrahydrofolate dehydrogenase (NADP+)/methenyltetrahydrofolate cyclohydrolase